MDNNKVLLIGGAAIALWFFLKQSAPTAADPQQSLIDAWIAKMRANPEWMAAEQQKAMQNNVTLDEQLLIDAKWMIEQNWVL